MNSLFRILAGVGVGLGLMYFLDPNDGARRRAMIRDKAIGMKNDLTEIAENNAAHMRIKAQGLLHDAKSAFENGKTENSSSSDPLGIG